MHEELTGRIDRSVGRAVDWLQTMLPEADGSEGIWERIRIDQDEIVQWVRPDCTAEARELFASAAGPLGRPELAMTAAGLGDWLLGVQNDEGSFPFYRLHESAPASQQHGANHDTSGTLYPNDNGKVLELLTLWPEGRSAADRLAGFLASAQNADGWFPMYGFDRLGPCFVAWPIAGLVRHAAASGDDRSASAARRALDYLTSLQLPDGRMRTTYELQQGENWRPVSSEAAESLRAFSLAHRLLDIDLSAQIEAVAGFLHRLSTDDGAIRNCDDDSLGASQQEDGSLTDLVYTCGYALHGWLDAWRATSDTRHLEAARRLGEFLIGIQVDDATVNWDGAWRGSYDIDQRTWRGRANQSNPIDEGGEFSVYTGWTTATIANGLLRLRTALATRN